MMSAVWLKLFWTVGEKFQGSVLNDKLFAMMLSETEEHNQWQGNKLTIKK